MRPSTRQLLLVLGLACLGLAWVALGDGWQNTGPRPGRELARALCLGLGAAGAGLVVMSVTR